RGGHLGAVLFLFLGRAQRRRLRDRAHRGVFPDDRLRGSLWLHGHVPHVAAHWPLWGLDNFFDGRLWLRDADPFTDHYCLPGYMGEDPPPWGRFGIDDMIYGHTRMNHRNHG